MHCHTDYLVFGVSAAILSSFLAERFSGAVLIYANVAENILSFIKIQIISLNL
jgi:hypothetical protein